MPDFICEICDFKCSKSSNYTKHLLTRKHKWKHLETFGNQKKCRFLTSIDEEVEQEKMPISRHQKKCRFSTSIDEEAFCEKMPETCDFAYTDFDEPSFVDEGENSAFFPISEGHQGVPMDNVCTTCMRKYKHRSGLWKHRTKCTPEKHEQRTNALETMVNDLMKQNQEIKEMLVKQMDEIQNRPPVIQQINNTTHNHFNLNVFLNEQCKDALNISEFVDKLQVQFSDLECVGKLGYVEGIFRIIANELNQLSVYERPIHCTDIKRETIYIKDQNQWNRETENTKIKTVIETVANKNMKLIPEWYKTHPDACVLDSNVYNQHMAIMIESIGGLGGSSDSVKEKQQQKIIKSVLREVYLDKDKHLKKQLKDVTLPILSPNSTT